MIDKDLQRREKNIDMRRWFAGCFAVVGGAATVLSYRGSEPALTVIYSTIATMGAVKAYQAHSFMQKFREDIRLNGLDHS